METENKKAFSLKLIFNVLFWGAVWGIMEATLGTLLHLPLFDKAGMYACSSTIIIPLAYILMANCYKKTESFYAVYLMGLIASAIKLTVAFFVGFIPSVYNPAIYIVVEALMMGTALLIFRPKNVLSLKTLGAMMVANTLYQFAFLVIKMLNGGTNIFASEAAWKKGAEPYLFTINCLAILYTFGVGAIAFGILKVAEKYNWKFKFDLNKFIISPITAAVSLTLAITVTITLSVLL